MMTSALVAVFVLAGCCLGDEVDFLPRPYWPSFQAGIVRTALWEATGVAQIISYNQPDRWNLTFEYVTNQGHQCQGQLEDVDEAGGIEGWTPLPPVKNLFLVCKKSPGSVKPPPPVVELEDNWLERDLNVILGYVADFAAKEAKGVTAEELENGDLKWLLQSIRENSHKRFSCTIGIKTDHTKGLKQIDTCWKNKCGFLEIVVHCEWTGYPEKSCEENKNKNYEKDGKNTGRKNNENKKNGRGKEKNGWGKKKNGWGKEKNGWGKEKNGWGEKGNTLVLLWDPSYWGWGSHHHRNQWIHHHTWY